MGQPTLVLYATFALLAAAMIVFGVARRQRLIGRMGGGLLVALMFSWMFGAVGIALGVVTLVLVWVTARSARIP